MRLIKLTNIWRRGLVLSTVLLSVVLTGTATATGEGNSHPMRFGHLDVNDGLSQSNVLSVLQDSEGWMWFATENGLNSYDGYEFRYFKRERGNADALSNDFIFDVAEAADGSLWLATNGGGLAISIVSLVLYGHGTMMRRMQIASAAILSAVCTSMPTASSGWAPAVPD